MRRRQFLGRGGPLALGIAAAGRSAAAPSGTAERTLGCDVLVCGGGPAGVAAATMAARQGVRVLLVERYGRLGGMAVHALVGPLMGRSESPFVGEVLKRIGGVHASPETLDLEYAGLVQEAGGGLLLHAWAAETLRDGNRVVGVRLLTKEGFLRVEAEVVVDATGDGDIAAGAGAAFEQGRPGDGLLQPVSIMYRIGGVDTARGLLCGSEEQARVTKVPGGTWEAVVHKGQADGELPPAVGVIRVYRSCYAGERVINATQINGVNGLRVEDLTRAELEGRRQAKQVLEFLRRHAPGHESAYLSAMPAAVGVRETRRFLGEQTLARSDVVSGRKRDDAVVRDASFPIDIHNPAGGGQAEGTAAKVKPYDIPYGCLVPKGVDGLLLAGRCISGSHDAHASYRVQLIAMAIGSAAGAAAAIAVRKGVAPRAVDAGDIRRQLGLQARGNGQPARSETPAP